MRSPSSFAMARVYQVTSVTSPGHGEFEIAQAYEARRSGSSFGFGAPDATDAPGTFDVS